MTTTHDDNATTWRDLADQLTTDQLAFMERFEETALGDPALVAEHLLERAREDAAKNLRDDAQFGHLPLPTGAQKIWHWEDDDEGNWSRLFSGTDRGIGLDRSGPFANRVDVSIDGVQQSDGSIIRTINVYANGAELTEARARELAAALVEAADELDQLTGTE